MRFSNVDDPARLLQNGAACLNRLMGGGDTGQEQTEKMSGRVFKDPLLLRVSDIILLSQILVRAASHDYLSKIKKQHI